MSTILSIREVKRTQRVRKCAWCGERIGTGEPSTVINAMWDGDFSAVRMHPECQAGWSRTNWRQFDEWQHYEQERGLPLTEDTTI